MEPDSIHAAGQALGVRLASSGDCALLNRPRRALLVSRGERVPTPATHWISQTVAATQALVARGEVLVTSAGRIAYDAALFTCFKRDGAAIVVLKHAPGVDEPWRRYLPKRHLLVFPESGQTPLKKPQQAAQRDMLVGWLADSAYAIHVSPSGNMAKVSVLLKERGCAVETWPSHECAARLVASKKKPVDHDAEIPPDEIPEWDYLTHFTREPDGAWPGEERSAYLEWLCSGAGYAPRDSFATLCRILTEQRLRACGRLTPNRSEMVCFTALSPESTRDLRKWRRGLLRWSFTSYGLAFKKDVLIQAGAQPVVYATDAEFLAASSAQRSFLQRERSGNLDWTREKEWRFAGDIDLSQFDRRSLLALVETEEQRAHIEAEFGIASRLFR